MEEIDQSEPPYVIVKRICELLALEPDVRERELALLLYGNIEEVAFDSEEFRLTIWMKARASYLVATGKRGASAIGRAATIAVSEYLGFETAPRVLIARQKARAREFLQRAVRPARR